MAERDKKKSRKDAQKELRKLEKEMSGGRSLIDYSKINQRHMDDKRFERELKNKEMLQEQADHGAKKGAEQAPSATYDAFMRMQTGQETRTIADKINDPNRVSWEKFRQDNADKLDIPGADRKRMIEYRAQLDAERDAALAKGRNRPKRKLGVSSSESEGEEEGKGGSGGGGSGGGAGDISDDGGSSSKRKKKKEKRSKKDKDRDRDRDGKSASRKKKHSKSKKSSKRSRKEGGDESAGSTDSDGGSGAEEAKKKRRKEKKKRKAAKESDPRRLSQYLQGSSASESD